MDLLLKEFQYPHRIVGGFKPAITPTVPDGKVFQYPHRIVGGFKNAVVYTSNGGSICFSILIGSSGGSRKKGTVLLPLLLVFQYPHRIVGGFKSDNCFPLIVMSFVSVSSSDRRGVQAFCFTTPLPC